MKIANKNLRLDIRLLDRSLANDSLAEFVKQAWPIVEPTTPLQWNWHLEVICEYLEAVAAGDSITRLIINLPPRSGKSILASVMFPVWVWATRPSTRWLCASYSASLATRLSIDRRTVINSPWYQERWPIQLAGDQNQKSEFMNTARGHIISTSVSGSVTGKGGNFIVADDLQNPEMAESEVERNNVNRFFDETLSTRLDDKRRGRIIVIQQRTHQADLTGHLLDQGGWTQLRLPAEFERRTVIQLPRSRSEVVKLEGELLCPKREGRAELDAAKIRLGSFGYACQYQQAPVAREGNLIKIEWLGATTYRAIPERFDSLIMSIDTAFKTGATNDFSAVVVIGTLNTPRGGYAPGYYLLEAWRGKVEFADLKRRMIGMYHTWHPHQVLVEDAASGQSLIQELRSGTSLPIKAVRVDRDKLSRVAAISPILEARRLLLPEHSWWRDDLIAELISFPAGAHDDWVDALTMALECLRESNGHQWMHFYRLQVARAAIVDGSSIEEAAAEFQISTEEIRDNLSTFPLPHAHGRRYPWS